MRPVGLLYAFPYILALTLSVRAIAEEYYPNPEENFVRPIVVEAIENEFPEEALDPEGERREPFFGALLLLRSLLV